MGDEVLERKIRLITRIVIGLIVFAASISIFIVGKQTVKPVSGVAMADNSNSSIVVEWNELGNADGYYLYNYNKVENKLEKLATVRGRDNCSCTIDKLSGATVFDLRVYGYRTFLNKEYKSDEAQSVCAFTIPDALEVSTFSGGRGVFSIEWDTSDTLEGYYIQVADNEGFKNPKNLEISEKTTTNLSLKDLAPGSTYYARGKAFLEINGKKYFGKWGNVSSAVISEKDLDIANINPNKPMVALTFDDGPAFTYKGDNSTSRILDTLEKYGARATFFMVGERVDDETKALLQREIELGCELGNHTYNHKNYGSDVTPYDIEKASKRIKKYCGKAPTMFRCPGGNLTNAIRNECKDQGMPLAYWSIDTLDWKTKDAKKIYNRTTKQVYDGAIILMHDIYPSTADAVEKLVPALIEKGYQIVTVTQLIEAKTGDKPKPGQQYVDYETINNNTK